MSGEDRTDQGAGAGDGGKVVPKKHPFARGVVVGAVVMEVGGCAPRPIQGQHFGGDKGAVIPVGDRQNAERADHERKGTHDGRNYISWVS